MRRIDEIIVIVLVRSYNELGRPTGEQQAQPIKLFRKAAPDVWARLDDELAKSGIVAPIDEIIVTVVVRAYDDDGSPIGEIHLEPSRIFRAAVPDVWRVIDVELADTTRLKED